MIDLFVYGTLMHKEIFERVTKFKQSKQLFENKKEATLMGHQAFYVADEFYPGLKKVEDGKTEGIILHIPTELLEFLFQYEGPEDYDLVSMNLTSKGPGEKVQAKLFLNTGKLDLTDKVWTYQAFLQKGEDQKILQKLDQWITP